MHFGSGYGIRWRFLSIHYSARFRCGWMRVCGYGIAVRDLRRLHLCFSERNGYCWGVRVGWLFAKWLDP